MVQVWSHSRQRQNDVTVMTLASVSMILLLQNGHAVGFATGSLNSESRMRISVFRNTWMPAGPLN